jgi:hypothetical protein
MNSEKERIKRLEEQVVLLKAYCDSLVEHIVDLTQKTKEQFTKVYEHLKTINK